MERFFYMAPDFLLTERSKKSQNTILRRRLQNGELRIIGSLSN